MLYNLYNDDSHFEDFSFQISFVLQTWISRWEQKRFSYIRLKYGKSSLFFSWSILLNSQQLQWKNAKTPRFSLRLQVNHKWRSTLHQAFSRSIWPLLKEEWRLCLLCSYPYQWGAIVNNVLKVAKSPCLTSSTVSHCSTSYLIRRWTACAKIITQWSHHS